MYRYCTESWPKCPRQHHVYTCVRIIHKVLWRSISNIIHPKLLLILGPKRLIITWKIAITVLTLFDAYKIPGISCEFTSVCSYNNVIQWLDELQLASKTKCEFKLKSCGQNHRWSYTIIWKVSNINYCLLFKALFIGWDFKISFTA